MNEMEPLKRHYLLSFPWVFLALISMIVVKGSFLIGAFITLGFLWVWTPLTPGLREKIKAPRYRVSFFRLMYWMIDLAEDQLFFASDKLVKTTSRIISGLFFAILISLVSDLKIVIWNFIGLALGEIWLVVNKKFYEDAYKKREPSLSENSL